MDATLSPPPPTTSTGGVGGGGGKQSQTQKFRLMISYGGLIIPRPHTKTLLYAGGETRIISVPRTTALSLSSLLTHLSKTLFNNGSHSQNLLLKYQLPHHDLDSLISILSNEDLHNMIDEYDRLASTGRIRFFLFKKDEAPVNGGGVDDWFADVFKVAGTNPNTNCGGSGGGDGESPESIVLESSSSFGSTSSSNSPGNCKGGDDLKLVLPSVDSLGSDTSIPSPDFSQQAIVYQDASGFVDSKPVPVNLIETESSASGRSPHTDIQTPVQVSGYMISKPPMDQPQYPSPSPSPRPPPPAHYIHHPSPASQSNYVTQYYPSSIPVAYTPMYQPYAQSQQHYQYQLNKPYPVYLMPVGQTQNLYDASCMHHLTTTPQTVSLSQPQVPSNPVMVASPIVYEGYKPTAPRPEYADKVYGPTSVETQPVTSPPPVNQSSQSVSTPPLENPDYISDYEDPMHAQIYKTQPSGPTLSSQLQMLSEGFGQLQVENAKH